MIGRLISAILHTPPLKLLRYAPILAVVAVIPLGSLAYFTSRNPIYCGNCHKKSQEPELWSHSKLHPKSVTCIDCHATTRGFILRNFSAQPSRVNQNCRRCHELEDIKKIGAPGYKFKGNRMRVRIPHELHVVKVGANCTDCHYNIVHDRRQVKTNTPPMEGCLSKCHKSDAKNCRKCHPAGTVLPPITATLDPDTCRDCHGDFLHKQLEFAGREYRHIVHIRSGVLCGNCHSNADKHGQMLVKTKDCDRCHSMKKPGSHTESWRKVHGKSLEAEPDGCEVCHQQRFCDACHGLPMPHGTNWRKEHASAGVGSATVCSGCHNRNACRSCHMSLDKSPHGRGWIYQHGVTANASKESCSTCHEGKLCSSCHGTQMPHPTGWLTRHGQAAMNDANLCAKCHASGKKNDCAGCHRALKPKFHTAGFAQSHPGLAKQKPELCTLCHSKNGCNDCHKTPMPHAKDWSMTHGSKGASLAKGSFCFNCHKDRNGFCGVCHELE